MDKKLADVSRRSFLGAPAAAAGAAAAFQIIRPELVRGQGKPKMTAGIVGTGGRGTRGVAEMLTGNPNGKTQWHKQVETFLNFSARD